MVADPVWWAAIDDTTGELVSVGTVIENDVPDEKRKETINEAIARLAAKGVAVLVIDGPQNGRPWDPATRTFGVRAVEPTIEENVEAALAAEKVDPTFENTIRSIVLRVLGKV